MIRPIIAAIMHKPGKIAPSEAQLRIWLLDMVREFERITAMSKSAIGLKALNDTNWLFRVEAGEDFTMKNYRRVHEFMVRNWPRDTVPAPKRKSVTGRRAA